MELQLSNSVTTHSFCRRFCSVTLASSVTSTVTQKACLTDHVISISFHVTDVREVQTQLHRSPASRRSVPEEQRYRNQIGVAIIIVVMLYGKSAALYNSKIEWILLWFRRPTKHYNILIETEYIPSMHCPVLNGTCF